MKKVTFIQDFATKVRGDVWECDSQLASHLVHEDMAAVYGEISANDLDASYPLQVVELSAEAQAEAAEKEAAENSKKSKVKGK